MAKRTYYISSKKKRFNWLIEKQVLVYLNIKGPSLRIISYCNLLQLLSYSRTIKILNATKKMIIKTIKENAMKIGENLLY